MLQFMFAAEMSFAMESERVSAGAFNPGYESRHLGAYEFICVEAWTRDE